MIKINGAADRLVHTGDTVIILSYAQLSDNELAKYQPRVVHVESGGNQVLRVDHDPSALLTNTAGVGLGDGG